MSYELIESGRRKIIVQKGEPTFNEPASTSRRKEIQMKSNMKKLVVFGIIAAIAMLTAVSTASAGWNLWKYIILGDYAVTGANQCVLATAGFMNPAPGVFTPNSNPGAFQISNGFIEGVYTFHVDGTGTFTGLAHTNTYPALGLYSPTSALGELTYAFTYTVSDGGVITFKQGGACSYTSCSPIVAGNCTAAAPTYLQGIPEFGVVSPDGMNLSVTCGVPVILSLLKGPAAGTAGCPANTINPDLAGPQLSCNISLTGFKVPKTITLPVYP
jgi:hypothetical protein